MDDSLFIEIQRYCEMARQRGLRELSISREGFSLSLSTVPASVVVEATAATSTALPMAPVLPIPVPVAEVPAAPVGITVASPLVGTFYRAPSPDSAPFVEIGDLVEEGQTIGVVEAMKVFNEITSDHAGKVIAIPAKNGQLVHAGDPLVVLDA